MTPARRCSSRAKGSPSVWRHHPPRRPRRGSWGWLRRRWSLRQLPRSPRHRLGSPHRPGRRSSHHRPRRHMTSRPTERPLGPRHPPRSRRPRLLHHLFLHHRPCCPRHRLRPCVCRRLRHPRLPLPPGRAVLHASASPRTSPPSPSLEVGADASSPRPSWRRPRSTAPHALPRALHRLIRSATSRGALRLRRVPASVVWANPWGVSSTSATRACALSGSPPWPRGSPVRTPSTLPTEWLLPSRARLRPPRPARLRGRVMMTRTLALASRMPWRPPRPSVRSFAPSHWRCLAKASLPSASAGLQSTVTTASGAHPRRP